MQQLCEVTGIHGECPDDMPLSGRVLWARQVFRIRGGNRGVRLQLYMSAGPGYAPTVYQPHHVHHECGGHRLDLGRSLGRRRGPTMESHVHRACGLQRCRSTSSGRMHSGQLRSSCLPRHIVVVWVLGVRAAKVAAAVVVTGCGHVGCRPVQHGHCAGCSVWFVFPRDARLLVDVQPM